MVERLPPAQLQAFEASLKQLSEEIKQTLEQSRSASAPVELDQNRVGRLSRMDAIQGQAMAQAGRARQENALRATDKALHRIKVGEFGRCEECDDWIPFARLEFDPTAVHCVGCAAKLESN